LLLVFLAGVFGFEFLFDYGWIDAVYMTVITVTRVGFGELHLLTNSEKIFISLFIHGNANEDEVLIHARIERDSTLICALPGDVDNLFIVLSARQLNKN
jgi:voltage-gated potassium channel Kch